MRNNISSILAQSIGGRLWDAIKSRFVSAVTKRPIAESTVRGDIQRMIRRDISPQLKDITERMLDGKIDLGTWQKRMGAAIKDAWGMSSSIGRGGVQQMTQVDWGRLGGRLRFEYQQLTRFAFDISDSKMTREQILFRADLYAKAVRTGYYDGLQEAHELAGYTEERRLLHAEESCGDCQSYAGGGWAPIGTYPSPGAACQCQRNCKCTKVYR